MGELEWITDYSKTDTCELHGHVAVMLSIKENDDYLKKWTKEWYLHTGEEIEWRDAYTKLGWEGCPIRIE